MTTLADIVINTVLTKQDIKLYYIEGSKKSALIMAVIFFILLFAAALTFDWDITFIIIEAVVLISALFLSFFLRYRAAINDFENNKSYEKERQYRFTREGYAVQTKNGFMSLSWRDITRVTELKPCFLIVLSVGKIQLVPKRCFADPVQLTAFSDLLELSVDRKKLKIKRYPFASFAPDTLLRFPEPDVAGSGLNPEPSAADASDNPLFRLAVQYSRKDLISLNLWYHYTKPAGIIGTVLGLLMLLVIIMDIILELDINVLMPAIICVYFLLLSPLLVYYQAAKMFKQDAAAKNISTYEFYSDRIVITNANGVNRKNIGDLKRLANLKSAYLLFISKRLTYIIPKRYIADKAAFDDYFRFIKAENHRQNNYAAANPPTPRQEPSRFCTNCGTPRPSPEHLFCPNCGKEYINK